MKCLLILVGCLVQHIKHILSCCPVCFHVFFFVFMSVALLIFLPHLCPVFHQFECFITSSCAFSFFFYFLDYPAVAVGFFCCCFFLIKSNVCYSYCLQILYPAFVSSLYLLYSIQFNFISIALIIQIVLQALLRAADHDHRANMIYLIFNKIKNS